MKLNYQNWLTKKLDVADEEYKLNNNLASHLAKKGFRAIIMQYTGMMPKQVIKLLKLEKNLWKELKGVGADLGGGIGCISSTIALKKDVKKIYCIDAVKNVVTKCQNVVKKKILGTNSNKMISVLGSFDDLKLKDSSLDFCISWESMHHSKNVVKTLKEAKRVLKKNGKIIIIDRGHNNSTPQKEINRMLNIQYSKEFLKQNWLPINKILTRKQNGEHEYRYREWEFFFKRANLKIKDSLILREKQKKIIKKNDAGVKELEVNFKLGEFQKSKVIYILEVKK